MDVNQQFITTWVNHLQMNPRKATEGLSVIIKGLKEPRSIPCQRRLISKLDSQPSLLLLLEHCMIQHQRLSDSESPGSLTRHAAEYIEKMLEFLCIWIDTQYYGPMNELFSGHILVGTITDLGSHDVVKSDKRIAYHLATLLKKFLDKMFSDVHWWFEMHGGLRKMKLIAEAFTKTCFGSGATGLLDIFFNLTKTVDFGDHSDMDIIFIAAIIAQAEESIKSRVKELEYDLNVSYFERQLITAKLYSPRWDFRGKAKAFAMIVAKLSEVEENEKLSVPAIKGVLVRELLSRHEPVRAVHDNYTEAILGVKRPLTQYERDEGFQSQLFDPYSHSELHARHEVYRYLETLELPAPPNTVRLLGPARMSTASSRRNRFRAIRREAYGDDDVTSVMSTDSDDSSSYGPVTPFLRFYQRETERMLNGVLRMLLGDDIDFESVDPDITDDDSSSGGRSTSSECSEVSYDSIRSCDLTRNNQG